MNSFKEERFFKSYFGRWSTRMWVVLLLQNFAKIVQIRRKQKSSPSYWQLHESLSDSLCNEVVNASNSMVVVVERHYIPCLTWNKCDGLSGKCFEREQRCLIKLQTRKETVICLRNCFKLILQIRAIPLWWLLGARHNHRVFKMFINLFLFAWFHLLKPGRSGTVLILPSSIPARSGEIPSKKEKGGNDFTS